MKNNFKLWSEINSEDSQKLRPNLGMIDWEQLEENDKQKIWSYFKNKNWFTKSKNIYYTIHFLNERYKKHSYGYNLLNHGGPHYDHSNRKHLESLSNCCLNASFEDFKTIFLNHKRAVVYEMLSLFARILINDKLIDKNNTEEVTKRKKSIRIKEAYEEFDKLKDDFNDIFEQFGVNVFLSRNGIIFRQDKKITEEIYEPVLNFLSIPKWDKVNSDLKNSFIEYQKKTKQGYSVSITCAISALQAYLQIIVYGKTGKGSIKSLLKKAKNKKLIPDDIFSKKILKDIVSKLMTERQKKSNAHPKKEYATEKHARLVLNLVMIFLQHIIQE